MTGIDTTITLTTGQIINKIIGLTRKNHKRIATDEEVAILTTFRDGGELEKKAITKLKKILAKYSKTILPIRPAAILEMSPNWFKDNKVSHEVANYRMYISDDIMGFPKMDGYELRGLKEVTTEAAGDVFMYEVVKETINIIQTQLVDAIKEYTKEQDAAALRRKQEVIKGQVTKQILAGLMVIRNEWEIVIYDHTLASLIRMRNAAQEFINKVGIGPFPRTKEGKADADVIFRYMQNGVLNTDKQLVSDDTLKTISSRSAKDEADSFLYKMCDKIGGLKLSPDATIENIIRHDKKNPFNSTMKVVDTFGSFDMFNQIVINTSPLGNPFYQYPCIFENVMINGERDTRLSEYQIKVKINKLNLQ